MLRDWNEAMVATMGAPLAVETIGLGYTYPAPPVEALRGIDFALPRGAYCAVIGANGSGKSTLIKLVMGLLRPTAGEVRVMGRSPYAEPELIQRLIGYVPQRDALNTSVPLSARDVVGLAAATRLADAGGGRKVRDRVTAALEMVEMGEMMRRPFRTLSGGQQQRVLIARALAVDPFILVLDEPFAGVDAGSQDTIARLLHRLSREHGVTILAVVHNINPLVHFIDNLLLLHTTQLAFGSPAEVLTADNLQAAYGGAVPILVCDEGFPHPLMQESHE